jgi:hypothetical protein
MRKEAEAKADVVISALLDAGWKEGMSVETPGNVVLSAGGLIAGRWSSRRKFMLGKSRCTVGLRTTCFYDIGEGIRLQKCQNFRRYETKNTEAITKEVVATTADCERSKKQ